MCHLVVIWDTVGVHLGVIWVSFRVIWVSFGYHLGVMWGSVGSDLGVIWISFGCHLGFLLHYFGSRDASTLQHLSSLEAVFGGSQGYDLRF